MIKPKLIISRKNRIIKEGHKCYVCDEPASVQRRINPNGPKIIDNQIYACKSCHGKINDIIEKASKKLILYNGITPHEIIEQLKKEKYESRDIIEVDEPTESIDKE